MDLHSTAYFSGYAKLRISCLPVPTILLNALSCFFFTGFVFLSTADFSPHETLSTKFEFSVVLEAIPEAGLHNNGP